MYQEVKGCIGEPMLNFHSSSTFLWSLCSNCNHLPSNRQREHSWNCVHGWWSWRDSEPCVSVQILRSNDPCRQFPSHSKYDIVISYYRSCCWETPFLSPILLMCLLFSSVKLFLQGESSHFWQPHASVYSGGYLQNNRFSVLLLWCSQHTHCLRSTAFATLPTVLYFMSLSVVLTPLAQQLRWHWAWLWWQWAWRVGSP